ncbi:MAG: hypothetical protein DI596_02525 [Azospira oryzae]|nr:MAG: hypothetical protein DI596_02525 [Azospira oryzae]PZP82162.1 MAG: hypothetical protein DI593_02525 [Azospira oryzae]
MNMPKVPGLSARLPEGALISWRGSQWRIVWRDRTRAVLQREEDGALATVRIEEDGRHETPCGQ